MNLSNPSRPFHLRLSAALIALAFTAGACGGDDGGDDTATDDEAAQGQTGDGATGGGGSVDGECAGTSLEFSNTTLGTSGTATSAIAKTRDDGATFNVYIADYELSESDVSSYYPDVPEGSNVVLVQYTVFNAPDTPEPIEAGTEVEWSVGTDDVLAMTVSHLTTNERFEVATEGETEGTATITGVGDQLCFEIDYVDGDKEISGTVEASVVSS